MSKKYGDISEEKPVEHKFQECFDEVEFFGDILEELDKAELPEPARRKIKKCIGVLHCNSRTTKKGEVGSVGTAFLLSPKLALTVAHNLFNKDTREVYQEIKFYPGHQGRFEEGCKYEVEDFFFPGRFTIEPKPATKYDFALLKLSKEVPNINKEDFISLNGEYQKLAKETEKLCIFGYPFPKYEKEEGKSTARPWGMAERGRVVEIQGKEGNIFHKVSTLGGHSGSPILRIDQSGGLSIIGIHKGGDRLGAEIANVGRLVTPELIGVLEAGARSMEAGL